MATLAELMKNPFVREEFDAKNYWDRNKQVGVFGVPYLDKELNGIAKTDLVLIGARSGAGKSSLAKIIYAANDKSKTALFSLENYDGDLEMSLLRQEYGKITGKWVNARLWQMGIFKEIDEKALDLAQERVKDWLDGSYIFGRVPPNDDPNKQSWTVDTLSEKIIWCATHGIELIIVDHLDYLDRDNPNESDNAHITELMKAIRTAQEAGSAVVAFSHLRKPIGKVEDLIVPNENEFIGSSNKVKQATQVIMFAPANDGDEEDGYGTWCCIRKNRNGGIKNQAAKLFFLPATESYKPEYEIYTINYAGTKAEGPIESVGLFPCANDKGKMKFMKF
jgi:replicative DNA helicase